MSPVRYELGFYIPEYVIHHSHRRDILKSHVANLHINNNCGLWPLASPSDKIILSDMRTQFLRENYPHKYETRVPLRKSSSQI
jgi:hypothetical protein